MDTTKIKLNKIQAMTLASIKDRDSIKFYETEVDGEDYLIVDSSSHKIVVSPAYNYVFDKANGNFARWGSTQDEDPDYSPIGGEILDIEVTTSCSGVNGKLCPFCSPAGTNINTVDGEKPIETLEQGDMVIGYDTINNRPSIQRIEETYVRDYCGELICIELDSGETLKLTPNHEVFLKNGELKKADDLSENDELIFF